MDDAPTRYPLAWPAGFARTPADARDSSSKFQMTFELALKRMQQELRTSGALADSVIISTNIPVRVDGLPYATRRPTSDDPGVAVYWLRRNGDPMAMACDRYNTILGNLRGLALTLEALRAVERHGSSEILQRVFSGFLALPERSSATPWWQTLGFEAAPASFDEASAAYRRLIAEGHPDKPGGELGPEALELLRRAKEQARAHYG